MVGQFVAVYLVAGVMMAVVDAIWLSVVANKLYKQELGSILAKKPRFVPAVLFYLIFLAGLSVFVIIPALDAGSFYQALGIGALFGFVTYATYDLTNRSTLKDFTFKITVIDMIWGTALSAVVSSLTFLIVNR